MVATAHKPVLIVIAGPNGSGKTTITTQILQHEWMENAIYINPDQIAKDKFGDWNSREAIMQSVKYCEQLREECLRQRRSLIFETVLSADDKLDYILYLANRSSDQGWKNVVKEYQVAGKNVVHYNLPEHQQKAVEEYLGVQGFPTNIVFGRDGKLHKVLDFPLDIEAVAGLLEKMK